MMSLEERFWSKVAIGEHDECWEWKRGKFLDGYGSFKFMYVSYKSHRIAYQLTYEDLPDWDPDNPIVVRHKCDNPPCCNPAHLELGTYADNMRDKVERGRSNVPSGLSHWQASKTTCPRGHLYGASSVGKTRQCKTCRRDNQRLRRRAKAYA